MNASACVPALFAILFSLPASAHRPAQEALQGVRVEQRLGQSVSPALEFRDEAGKPVRLDAYLGAKPTIVSLVYFECPNLCTHILNGLVKSLQAQSLRVGRDFTVLSVSINPDETPDLAAAKKRTYLRRYDRPGAEQGWHFLTGAQPSIRALADALGFHYAYDPETRQYAHPSAIALLTPNGAIARYFFGIEYAPRDLRLGLVEASAERIGTPIDHVLLRCYRYDPVTGRYGLVIMELLRLGAIATLVVLAAFIFAMTRRDRQKRARHATEGKG
ncbi:SCO family protein [bacterium]|nr:SCO family protein [bacterium]